LNTLFLRDNQESGSSKNRSSHQKVFAAGDATSGASLVVNAIASGRKAAKEIDRFLKISE
jgi:NADPH-dependent glutamate synthase beta subunit-like oxidoreductase